MDYLHFHYILRVAFTAEVQRILSLETQNATWRIENFLQASKDYTCRTIQLTELLLQNNGHPLEML